MRFLLHVGGQDANVGRRHQAAMRRSGLGIFLIVVGVDRVDAGARQRLRRGSSGSCRSGREGQGSDRGRGASVVVVRGRCIVSLSRSFGVDSRSVVGTKHNAAAVGEGYGG